MSALRRLQEEFQHHVLDGAPEFIAAVQPAGAAAAAERAGVYREGYRLRLLEALGKDYPALKTLLGEAGFEAMGREYIDAHPSGQPSLRWFGRRLAGFLEARPPYRARPELAELAALEWAQGEAFDEADAVALGVDAMAGVTAGQWAEMSFGFQPAIRCLRLCWNVNAIWKAAKEGHALPEPARGDRPADWLVWRRDRKVYWRSVPPDEAGALRRAREGDSFAAICEVLCRHAGADQAALRAASLLKQWLIDGLVSAIRLSGPS